VVLSSRPVRDQAFARMGSWLEAYATPTAV